MGRREQIRERLEAARRSRDAWVALMRSTALADLRDLLAVADAAARYRSALGGASRRDIVRAREHLDAALDRLDNGGDR